MLSKAHFMPFPSSSIPGGYLTWTHFPSPVLVLWHQTYEFWEIQYPISGIEVACTKVGPETWRLLASSQDIGSGPAVPLLTCTCNRTEGLVETYRYTYPPNYAHPQEIERFNQEIDHLLICFQGLTDLFLAYPAKRLGPPLTPGQVSIVSPSTKDLEFSSWHLQATTGTLYLLLGLFSDDVTGVLRGPIFKKEARVPLAFLTLNPRDSSYTVESYLGYLESQDHGPCTQLAQAALNSISTSAPMNKDFSQ